jgi:hypothetical protein
MIMISNIEARGRVDIHRMIFQDHSEKPPTIHTPTLDDVQIRAYRLHQKHGAVYGGYTLDEWLEAERELNEEQQESQKRKDQRH